MRFLSLFLLILFVAAKPPSIGPKDVKTKVEEIFKAHASHKKMTSELMTRTFQNFLEELDPSKTYFLADEIERWAKPSPETLEAAVQQFRKAHFSEFEEIHTVFLKAIDRHNELEKKLETAELPQGVKSEEFKDLNWADNAEDLETRLLRIRGLQREAANNLSQEQRDKFWQRLEKRRKNREAEFRTENTDDRLRTTLSYVLKATASALDAHTNYFTPTEANQFMIQVQQRLFGIGAQLRDDLDGLSVIRIFDNSPASNKLKINDKIIAVSGEPIVGMDIVEAVELIRGEKDSKVVLAILRENTDKKTEKLEIELVRNEIVIEESRLETALEPYGDGVIAHVKLFSFYQDEKSSSASDMRKWLEKVKQEHTLKGVVLDVRGNAGGLLTQAVSVSGLFMNKGIVCSIKDSAGKVQHLRELEGKPVWEGPLVVVTNRASASAAEIVAQTLQDYGRALVVGDESTFGKGSFQTFTLDAVQNTKINPQGEYKVTRGRYYTVSGKSPQLNGVEANVVVPGLLSELEIGEKFSKFPLENESLEPHFEDDLSDISPMYKIQLGPLYQYNRQKKLTTYEQYLDTLQKNSKLRVEQNKNYQNFLTEIKKKNYDSTAVDLFGQSDLQLSEAMNVMKDLIFLTKSS